MVQEFFLTVPGGLTLDYDMDGKTIVTVSVLLPGGEVRREVGEGSTDVAAARVAVQKALAPVLDISELRVHKTGIKRERRSGGDVLGADTCYWLFAALGGQMLKGHGRAAFPTAAFVTALLHVCSELYRSRREAVVEAERVLTTVS